MTMYRQDIDFQSLFRKLGHNLEEIRVRALENINSKLEHNLICEQDIIHERHLIIRLLEWFNFTPCNKKAEVLGLLCRLSQHWGAAELIQGVGGIEFLTQLREDSETSVAPLVDRILENVMRLPQAPAPEHAPECIYQKPLDSALWGNTMTSADDASRSRLSAAGGSLATSLPSVTAEKLGYHDNEQQGYFEGGATGNSPRVPQPDLKPEQTAVGFKMSTFPWLPLTMTDRHVIQSTNRSLQSKDVSMLTSACEFLSDVVFQDFPAEIFLQRPHIVKSLLSLVGLSPTVDERLVVCASGTLSDLCRSLHARIRYYQDPVLYTPKQDFSSSSPATFSLTGSSSSQSVHSTDTRPSLIGWNDQRHRGDGRDGDSSGSASRDSSVGGGDPGGAGGRGGGETDVEEGESIQWMQMSLPHYAATVLLSALPALRTPSQPAATALLTLAFQAWRILAVVVGEEVWTSGGESAKELVSKLKSCLETSATLLDYHHHSRCRRGSDSPTTSTPTSSDRRGDPGHHRKIYLGVANLLSHLLHLVPNQQAADVIPDQLHDSLGAVLFDESLALSYPQCHAVITHVAQLLDLEAYHLLCQVAAIRQSMQDTSRFVLQAQSKSLAPEEALALADSAVTSLPYHRHLNLISEFVAFFSYISSRKSADKGVQSRCVGVLLKLVAHPLVEVRHHAYLTQLSTVQRCLNAETEAASSRYTGHLEAKFLLNSDVLYQIVCFGLADPDNKVCTAATELLFHLLQSHLLLGDLLWGELVTSLLKSLPVLQSYTDTKTRFGRRLWALMDPSVASDNLCLLDKLRGNLRLMLSPDIGLRDEAVKRLCWFLAHESEAGQRLPGRGQLDPALLPSLFIVETPCYLDDDNTRSVFQVDGLKQVYDIFSADPVDAGVKKSAADQLAIMLQDPHLHGAFRERGGLEVVLSTLHQSMAVPSDPHTQNPCLPLVPACVSMLRYLLHHDYTLRHNLAHDPNIYYDLLRVSIMLVRDEGVSYQVSHILTLLLFDEVAKFDVSSSQTGKADRNFSVPAVITKRYRLPFRPTVHHTVSPSTVLSPPEHDALQGAAPQEMLRVAWNVAWAGGLDPLLDLLKAPGGDTIHQLKDFNKAMVLTHADRQLVTATGLRWGLQRGVHALANATSHVAVVTALQDIGAAMATSPSAQCAALLNQLNWSAVLDRFLQVSPSSPQDETLLLEVLRFITGVITMAGSLPDQVARWLARCLHDDAGPLVALLNRSPGGEGEEGAQASVTVRRSLDKVLLHFIATFISRLPYKLHTRVSVPATRGDLARRLLARLNISAAPHFYNLAALEGTLVCLMHLTARPGWSEETADMEPMALTSHVLNSLLEVVSAFHIGRGGTAMSYMGRGVTKAATLCLRHLAHEMVTYTTDKEWARNWLYSRQGADAVAEPGLNWMLTLWAYRDAEVRAAGLGIAVALTTSEVGRVLVTNNCKHIPGGIWGAAFSVLLDQSECSVVRQQAALLLVNLTSETIPSGGADSPSASVWQGPVVMDVESNVSLVGLNALLALLHHSHFYPLLANMLNSFFPSTVLQPVMVTTEVPLHSLDSSQTTVTSTESSPRGRERGQWSAHTTDQEANATSSARSTGRSGHSSSGQQDSHSQVSVTSSSSGTTRTGLNLDSTSSSSQGTVGEGEGEGMSSVVTPCLVAAVTQLLGNLVVMAPHDTLANLASHNIINTLVSMLDTALLQDLCRQLTSDPHRSCSMLTLRDLLRLYSSIVSLLAASIRINSPARAALLGNKGALTSMASLLLLQCHSAGELVMECRHLWLSVLRLLCTLLQTQSAAALLSLTEALAPIWTDFCDALVHLLEVRSGETEELTTALTSFLSLLLTEEGRVGAREAGERCQDSNTLTHLLDVNKAKNTCPAEKGAETPAFTTAASLARVLVSTYELTSDLKAGGSKGKVSRESLQVINTLKSLLAVSQSATHTALDMGLVEMLVDAMKEIHARLSLDSLHAGGKSGRRKDEGMLQELILTINILRNLLCGNEHAKLAATHSSVGAVIHKLWAWCLQEPSLMSATVALLINLTAQCPAAATALATTTSGSVGPGASRQQQISNSLVLAVVKATQRELERETLPSSTVGPGVSMSQLKLFFTLLASLALSPECRTLIWKSSLLQDFSRLSPGRSRKSRSRQLMDAMWFQLAVALSFSSDGQQMLLRIDECLTVLLDYLNNGFGSPHCQEAAALVLRNMCCHTANKPKLLANEHVIPCCVDLVESAENSKIQTLAASALWALAYNNHKAKVAMKNVNVIPRMRACLKSVQNVGHSLDDVQCSENIQAVISTISS